MADDFLDYGKLIDDAMHQVVRKSLILVQQHGLPHDHHFFITFRTGFPGVMISDELKERYPEEMTIVMQHQFWDLEVEEDRFSIVLSFDNVKQNLTVPFDSLVSFADPSVKFGLQFHHDLMEPSLLEADMQDTAKQQPLQQDLDEDGKPKDNVVTLDSFRKKSKK